MLQVQARSTVPTEFGNFTVYAFSENQNDWSPQLVWVADNTDFSAAVNVRFHSECITGEVFHSKKCECGQQLSESMKYVSEHGGIIIYLRQGGRNIGIINKLRAYSLQEKGFDTVEANLMLGLEADGRSFDDAIQILKMFNIKEINLLTNNPEKLKAVQESGIRLKNRLPMEIEPNEVNSGYLDTKKSFFGHLLEKTHHS